MEDKRILIAKNNVKKKKGDIMATDPVCGMEIENPAGICMEHNGVNYEFCLPSCKEKFAAAP